ncbi:cation:proton antiporter, partial [Enterococcus faecium]
IVIPPAIFFYYSTLFDSRFKTLQQNLADLVGLSSVIGAFFAGIAVSQTKVKEEVYHNVEALGYAVFIPVFFVSVGLEVDFSDFGEQLLFISILTLVAILTKLLGGYFGAQIAGFSQHSSLMVG